MASSKSVAAVVEQRELETCNLRRDSADLVNLGYEPILKRRFGLLSTISFCCLSINIWGCVLYIVGVPLTNGGLAGAFWGWIFVWSGTFAIYTSLAELASIAPSSGGQYHWVALLSPASSQRVLSYITGWLTVLGWLSAVASSTYLSGTMIQALIQFVDASYEPQLWHGTLLVYAIMFMCGIITIGLGRALPMIEIILMVVYALGFFAVIIPVIHLVPLKASVESVFLEFNNGGGWPTTGLSFFVGLQGWAFCALGADSAIHMSEEVHNASQTVPRAILLSLTFNCAVGTATLMGILFAIPNLDALLSLGLQYPFIAILHQSVNSVGGAAAMTALVIANQVALNISCVAAASRMLWSFARDRGVPGWRTVSWVWSPSPSSAAGMLVGRSNPAVAVAVTIVFTLLVALINIGSAVALNAVVSLCIDALFGSYLVACALLLVRRCQGRIRRAEDWSEAHVSGTVHGDSDEKDSTYRAPRAGAEGRLVWGPFHLDGWFGILVNAWACVYMVIIVFFSVWPPGTPTTAETMNFAIVMVTGVATIGLVYYLFWGRRSYEGPAVNIIAH